MLNTRERKSYKAFGTFLSRRGLVKGHSLATLFTEKFALSKRPSEWQTITADDLKEHGIFPSSKYKTFSEWRNEMIRSKVLICMATNSEIKDKKPNHKACLFKPGDKILKYIDISIRESLPQRVEAISEKVDVVSDQVINVNSKVDSIDQRVNHLEEKISNLTAIILKAVPPDTPRRRKIVNENILNHQKCLELLKNESDEIIM